MKGIIKNISKVFSNAINRMEIVILLSFVVTVIFAVAETMIILKGAITTDLQRIDALQSLTLTITGTAVAIVSLVTCLIGINRERKLKELEGKLSEAEESLTVLHRNEQIYEIYLLDDDAFFELKTNRLALLIDDKASIETNSHIYIILLQLYWNQANKLPDSEYRVSLLRQVIYYGQQMTAGGQIFDTNLILKYTVLYHLARANLLLGQYFCSRQPQKAKRYLADALQNFDKAEPLVKDVERKGAYYYYCGLAYFWNYKCKTFLAVGKEELVQELMQSIVAYESSIANNYNTYNVNNNMGVAYMQLATLDINPNDKEQHLNSAKKCFDKANNINPNQHLTYVNLADIEIRKMREKLEVETDPIRIGKTIDCNIRKNKMSFLHNLSEVLMCAQNAVGKLNRAKEIKPMFPNVHYKKAQIFCLLLAICYAMQNETSVDEKDNYVEKIASILPRADGQKEMENVIAQLKKQVEEELEVASSSSSLHTLGLLFIKRNYYDICYYFTGEDNYKTKMWEANVVIGDKSVNDKERWEQLFSVDNPRSKN